MSEGRTYRFIVLWYIALERDPAIVTPVPVGHGDARKHGTTNRSILKHDCGVQNTKPIAEYKTLYRLRSTKHYTDCGVQNTIPIAEYKTLYQLWNTKTLYRLLSTKHYTDCGVQNTIPIEEYKTL